MKQHKALNHFLAHVHIPTQGVQRIKKLFRQARRSKRSIIFIDEFDALARGRRSHSIGGSAESDAENTLMQLLTEMDGFQTQDNIIVLASTNRPEILDRAALRPGRFDRKVCLSSSSLLLHVYTYTMSIYLIFVLVFCHAL